VKSRKILLTNLGGEDLKKSIEYFKKLLLKYNMGDSRIDRKFSSYIG